MCYSLSDFTFDVEGESQSIIFSGFGLWILSFI